jgi:Fe-S cluster assembly iron-binding protein IscA
MAKAIPGMSFDKLDAKMKRQIVDQLINQTLIKDQVKKSGIQNTPQFKVAYAALRDDLAVDMWMKQQMGKITISENSLELIESISLDCTNGEGEIWQSDQEIKIHPKTSFVIKNGVKTKEFWKGTIDFDQKPKRIKIRSIAGDEVIKNI